MACSRIDKKCLDILAATAGHGSRRGGMVVMVKTEAEGLMGSEMSGASDSMNEEVDQ